MLNISVRYECAKGRKYNRVHIQYICDLLFVLRRIENIAKQSLSDIDLRSLWSLRKREVLRRRYMVQENAILPYFRLVAFICNEVAASGSGYGHLERLLFIEV